MRPDGVFARHRCGTPPARIAIASCSRLHRPTSVWTLLESVNSVVGLMALYCIVRALRWDDVRDQCLTVRAQKPRGAKCLRTKRPERHRPSSRMTKVLSSCVTNGFVPPYSRHALLAHGREASSRHPQAGSRCHRYDGAAAEVSDTSFSFRKPKLAEVCPTSCTKTNRELRSVDVTARSSARSRNLRRTMKPTQIRIGRSVREVSHRPQLRCTSQYLIRRLSSEVFPTAARNDSLAL
jgi:hypothetical protein